jgi:tripartite-type tricarboxylate transporter receptor subunit TctC
MPKLRAFSLLVSTISITFTAAVACGQDYPYRPIRIVTAAVGGGNDFQARIVGPGIASTLGQPVIVENKTGGVIAAEIAAKAPPDGYTLHIAGGALWLTPLLQKAPYDVNRDFAPISLMVREVFVLAVHPSVPVKSVQELIALAKARPGELNYGSDSTGARSHLSTEIFKSMAGVNIVRVAYKGGSTAITGAIGNEVQMVIFDAAIVMPQAKAGKLRALAVTSLDPSALVPGLPTIASAGLAGYESVGMTGIFVPAKTPSAIVGRLNREIVRVLNLPETREKYVNAGLEIIASSPEALAAAVKSDAGRMEKAIREAGIKVN